MLKIAKLAFAVAAAGLSVPVLAQSSNAPGSTDGFAYAGAEESGYQLEQYRYFSNEENERHAVWRQAAPAVQAIAPTRTAGNAGGFTYRGDGVGWEVTPHKLTFVGGRLAHSNECEHAVRVVQGPSPRELDAARNMSPGA